MAQPHARPHHWRLKNLQQMINLIAKVYDQSAETYLVEGPCHKDRDLVFYALAACLSGNCWDIQKAHGLTLQPSPPFNLRFGVLQYNHGQAIPTAVTAFQRQENTAVLYFRGTTTSRETWTDAKTLISNWTSLPNFGNSRFLSTLYNAYKKFDEHNPPRSLESFVRICIASTEDLIIIGHSLGGAMATLAAYQACQSEKRVTLITIGGAHGGDAAFCRELQRRCQAVFTIINSFDVVPWLHPLLMRPVQCCKLVPVDVSGGRGLTARALTHDPLYYAAALYRFGTSKLQMSCSGASGKTSQVSFQALHP